MVPRVRRSWFAGLVVGVGLCAAQPAWSQAGQTPDSPCPPKDWLCIAAQGGNSVGSRSGTASEKQYQQFDENGAAAKGAAAPTAPPAAAASGTFNGQGWTFDVFYCKMNADRTTATPAEIPPVAVKIRDAVAQQRNIGRIRLKPWPSGGGVAYQTFHPYEIRITDKRRTLAEGLKKILDPVLATASATEKFQFVPVGTDFPYYISIVVCPGA